MKSLALNFANLSTTSCAMNEEEGESDREESNHGCYDCHTSSVDVYGMKGSDSLAPAMAAVALDMAAFSLVADAVSESGIEVLVAMMRVVVETGVGSSVDPKNLCFVVSSRIATTRR